MRKLILSLALGLLSVAGGKHGGRIHGRGNKHARTKLGGGKGLDGQKTKLGVGETKLGQRTKPKHKTS